MLRKFSLILVNDGSCNGERSIYSTRVFDIILEEADACSYQQVLAVIYFALDLSPE
jgi:hypothetical protein